MKAPNKISPIGPSKAKREPSVSIRKTTELITLGKIPKDNQRKLSLAHKGIARLQYQSGTQLWDFSIIPSLRPRREVTELKSGVFSSGRDSGIAYYVVPSVVDDTPVEQSHALIPVWSMPIDSGSQHPSFSLNSAVFENALLSSPGEAFYAYNPTIVRVKFQATSPLTLLLDLHCRWLGPGNFSSPQNQPAVSVPVVTRVQVTGSTWKEAKFEGTTTDAILIESFGFAVGTGTHELTISWPTWSSGETTSSRENRIDVSANLFALI